MNRYDVMKNSAAFALMKRDADENRVSHAYLVVSPDEGMSDALASLFIASVAFGGTDLAAIERAENFGADIIRLPEGDKVLAGDIKTLTDSVYFTPTELKKKFYVIRKCETMNETSQNKLLKILEEPPESVVIILLAAGVGQILPTVLSRVRRVDAEPMPEAEMLRYLEANYGSDGTVYLAAALSGGYIGKAEKVMTEKAPRETFEFVLSVLKCMKNSRLVLPYSVRLGGYKDRLSEFIDVLELVLADCMRASAGIRDGLEFKNATHEIIEISSEYDADVVVRLAPAIRRARMRISLNGNPQSVADELLFSLLEVKAKCRKS